MSLNNSSLTQAIQEMRNMREAYDTLATSVAAMGDVQGKEQLAAAVSSKGVPTSTQDNLSSMAAKVTQIPQQLNTRTSDFEQMIAPTPYMWNVYVVATDLMKETLPDYLPAYMSEYKQRYGTNSFFVGEYYLGYATLELTGADGYLTCDGDFYTIAGEAGSRVVMHTLPDGTIETYAAESIIHTWHDGESGRCNRYVAFFYLSSAYSFTNTTSSICPRRVVICGECTSFIVSGENRLADVWVIGTLGHFEGGTTGDTWNPAQVIRNYKEHSTGSMYTNFAQLSSIITDLQNINGDGVIFNLTAPKFIVIPKIDKIEGNGHLIKNSNTPPVLNNTEYIDIHINKLSSVLIVADGNGEGGDGKGVLNKLREIHLRGAVSINSPIISVYNHYLNRIFLCPSLLLIDISDTEELNSVFISGDVANLIYASAFSSLVDVIVGELKTNFSFRLWRPTNVLANAIKKAQMIDNIKNHILARVSDATGGTQLVFTVSTNMYNNIASEQIEWQGETMSLADAFLTKNWLLAGA